jgi:hypothetical protein
MVFAAHHPVLDVLQRMVTFRWVAWTGSPILIGAA